MDVLLVPVGGTFTIGPEGAVQVIEALKPAVAVPMHYRHERVDLPLQPVSDFLRLVPAWQRVETQPVTFSRQSLPPPTRVLAMDPLH